MRINTMKEKLATGEAVYGWALGIGSAMVTENMARTGIDFLLLDEQHGCFDPASMSASIRAAALGSAIPMARPARNDYTMIARVLDEGVMGVVLPMVDTPAQAKAGADACRFPPVGNRSHGWNGAARLGDDYFDAINDQLFVAVQLESAEAIENAEAIMGTPGVDGCWVGPGDLSLSLGLDPRKAIDHPKFKDAIKRVLEACEKTGKVPGYAAFQPDDAIYWRQQGFRFLTAGYDLSFMLDGAKAGLKKLRA